MESGLCFLNLGVCDRRDLGSSCMLSGTVTLTSFGSIQERPRTGTHASANPFLMIYKSRERGSPHSPFLPPQGWFDNFCSLSGLISVFLSTLFFLDLVYWKQGLGQRLLIVNCHAQSLGPSPRGESSTTRRKELDQSGPFGTS